MVVVRCGNLGDVVPRHLLHGKHVSLEVAVVVVGRGGNLSDTVLRHLLHGTLGSLAAAVAVAARSHSKGTDASGQMLVVGAAAADRFHSREVDVAVLVVGTFLLADLCGGGEGYGQEESPWKLVRINLLWTTSEISDGSSVYIVKKYT